MTDRHSQPLNCPKAFEAEVLIRRECANVASRPGNPRDFHYEAEYMYATTYHLTGITLLQPVEGPYKS